MSNNEILLSFEKLNLSAENHGHGEITSIQRLLLILKTMSQRNYDV